MKLETYNYCWKTTHQTVFRSDDMGGLGRIASLLLTVRFLSLSFFDLFVTRTGLIGGPILTMYTYLV